MSYAKFGWNWLSSSRNEAKNVQKFTKDGQEQIVIGDLSDSGDLRGIDVQRMTLFRGFVKHTPA